MICTSVVKQVMSDARSIYKDDVDFAVLALQCPQFNRQ